MFFTVAQIGQTKSFYDNLRLSQVFSHFFKGEGEVRGIQLQHATSPLGVTKLYTLNL